MNIVCIAWGSLLWKPAALQLASGWHPDGPRLPLEFVRQSEDSSELALAPCERSRPMPTYWAYVAARDLKTARAMLGARERIAPGRPEFIGSIPVVCGACGDLRIAAWLRAKRIDAAVWTALPARWDGCNGRAPTALEALAWLDSLSGAQRAAAEEYIRCIPPHIDTRYRRLIEARLGWRPRPDAHVTRSR